MPLSTTLPALHCEILGDVRQSIFDRGFDALEIFNADRRHTPTPDASDAWVAFDMFSSLAAIERLEDKGMEGSGIRNRLRDAIHEHKEILAPLVAALFQPLPGEWRDGADMRDKNSPLDATIYFAALDDMELAHVTLDSLDSDLGLQACELLAGTVARVLESPSEWVGAEIFVRSHAQLMRDDPKDSALALTQHKFNVMLREIEEVLREG